MDTRKGSLEPPLHRVEDSNSPKELTQAEIERLGRQRPSIFRSAAAEASFVFSVTFSMMMSEYFISGFNIILPTIAADLDMPASEQTWPAEIINLTTAAFLLPSARLCDQYGGRTVFILGHVFFTLSSLAAGFSKSSIMLIACRALQGVGASAFLPAGISLLGSSFRPGPRKNLVFSFYGAMTCVGFYLGILLGATTAELVDWRWYFFIGTVLMVMVTITGFFSVPSHVGDVNSKVSMDWIGVATIVPGIVLFVYALTDGNRTSSGWRSPHIIITFVSGALLLCVAVYVEGWVARHPLLPAELFKARYMKRLAVSMFCAYGVFSLFLFYAAQFLQVVFHKSPLQTAAWFTPLAVGGICLAVVSGFVMHLLPGRLLLIISGVGFLASGLLFAMLSEKTDYADMSTPVQYWAWVFPAMICETIGADIIYNVTNIFITTTMPAHLQATGGALINTILYLGMAFWLGIGQLAVSVSVSGPEEGEETARQRCRVGFWLAVALSGASLLLNTTTRIREAAAEKTADEKTQSMDRS